MVLRYRRRWRRYFYRRRWRRYYRRNKRVDRPIAYASRQKLNFEFPLVIPAGQTTLNVGLNIYDAITRVVGWNSFVDLYQALRIYFVVVEIFVSTESDTPAKRQLIVFGFYPAQNNSEKTVQQVMALNNHGYSTYGMTQHRRLLWRATSSHSSIQGYGSPIPIQTLTSITGSFVIRNSIEGYFVNDSQVGRPIGNVNIVLYVEFYNNQV